MPYLNDESYDDLWVPDTTDFLKRGWTKIFILVVRTDDECGCDSCEKSGNDEPTVGPRNTTDP